MDVLPAQHHMCRDNKQTTKKRIDWVKKKGFVSCRHEQEKV
jgi:hypothetical protein